MYKKMDAAARCEQLQSIDFQLDVLEGILDEAHGPFVGGAAGRAFPAGCWLLPVHCAALGFLFGGCAHLQ